MLPVLTAQVVFLFSDTQIRSESFVEDISNLLNTGEVPNLMGAGDLATIFENLRPRATQAGMAGSKDELYEFFVREVRDKQILINLEQAHHGLPTYCFCCSCSMSGCCYVVSCCALVS